MESKNDSSRTVNIVLNGKGGIGKSFIAACLQQAAQINSSCESVLGIDTDPSNHTLKKYKSLNVVNIEIMDEHQSIDGMVFDDLVNTVIENDGPVIIDIGTTTFLPFLGYIVENDAIQAIQSSGKDVVFHVPIVGGQGFNDTLNGLLSVVDKTTAPIVVWENEHLDGEVSHNSKKVSESKIFIENKGRFLGVITLYKRNPKTFGEDLKTMTSSSMTFADAQESPLFGLMPKQRLNKVWACICGQINSVFAGGVK